MFFKLFSLNVYLTILLAIVAVVGDFLVSYSNLHLFQAIFDNATHAIIGGVSWLMVCMNRKIRLKRETLIEVILSALLSSLIDLDHFVAAKSIHLKDATNLTFRPPLHCSSVPLAICASLLGISFCFEYESLQKASLIVLNAFLTHHIRDATRRGFWFAPFGSTRAIPYYIYVLLICLCPQAIIRIESLLEPKAQNEFTDLI